MRGPDVGKEHRPNSRAFFPAQVAEGRLVGDQGLFEGVAAVGRVTGLPEEAVSISQESHFAILMEIPQKNRLPQDIGSVADEFSGSIQRIYHAISFSDQIGTQKVIFRRCGIHAL